MLGILTFGTVIVIHRSNYLIWASRKLISLINHNTACTTLKQWNIYLGAKWHRVCRFAPGSGQHGLIPYFLIFSISQVYNHICLHFVVEYMHCHGLSIPAKYHDNRLGIVNVGSISPQLCHFAPTSLIFRLTMGVKYGQLIHHCSQPHKQATCTHDAL